MFPATAACVNGLNISSSTPKHRSHISAPAKVILLFNRVTISPWPTLRQWAAPCAYVGYFPWSQDSLLVFACMCHCQGGFLNHNQHQVGFSHDIVARNIPDTPSPPQYSLIKPPFYIAECDSELGNPFTQRYTTRTKTHCMWATHQQAKSWPKHPTRHTPLPSPNPGGLLPHPTSIV